MDAEKRGNGQRAKRNEEKYGYDVKAAMHTPRLLYECKELMSQGEISLPRPRTDRKILDG